MNTDIVPGRRIGASDLADLAPAILETLVIGGDMSKLTPQQRLAYYAHRCRSVGLDPASRPFQYLSLQGKLTLYADKGCAQQLAALHKLTFQVVSYAQVGDCYVVQGRTVGADGRTTDDLGAVSIGGLKGDSLANAMMKARTKAHRRCVLSHCGLGELDETEIETSRGAKRVPVDSAHEAAPAEPPIDPPSRAEEPCPPPADEPPQPQESDRLREALLGLDVIEDKDALVDHYRRNYHGKTPKQIGLANGEGARLNEALTTAARAVGIAGLTGLKRLANEAERPSESLPEQE